MTGTELPLVEARLDNGLRVVVSEDHAVPAVAVNLWYSVGSRNEPAGRTGFAHLFEHLMFQGSANVKAGEHADLVKQVGGVFNGSTSFDRTNYYETVPGGALDLALWLEADRMGGLLAALNQENLDNQRDVVKNERRQRYDNVPYGTAYERLFRLTFPSPHPYHHMPIGSMEDLDAATLADVRGFFETYYLPANAVLSLVGDVDPKTALAAAERYFGPVPAGPPSPPPPDGSALPALPDGGAREDVTEQVPSDAVFLAWRTPPDGTPAADAAALLFRVLASGRASRLHRRLVRDEQLALNVGGGTVELIGGASLGYVAAYARHGVELDALEAALDAEATRLAADGPTDDELAMAKAVTTRWVLEDLNTFAGRADEISRHATLHGDPGLVNTITDRIAAVGADAVRAVAAQRLTPDNRAVLAYRREEASA